ncbi:hypothetical protein Tco_1525951 [Tanacetum coccineum]
MNRYGYSRVGRFDVFFRNQLLVFQQHQDESLYDSWTRFKDVIRKVLNHGLSIWNLVEIFLKHLDSLSHHIFNLAAEGDLRKFSDIEAWDDMVRVQVPRCMPWLDYDEHVDSPSMMNNEAGVTSSESTTQILPSFEEYTPPVTYREKVEKTLGSPIEVEPLNKTKLEEVGLNCNHNTPLSSREVPSFDGNEPQPLLKSPSLDVSLGDVIGTEPPIKPHSPDSCRMKVVDYLTTQTPPSPHMENSHPKGKSVSLGVDISNWEMFDDDWRLESKEVSPLVEELSLFDRPNEVERGRILEEHRLEPILQQQNSQRMAPSHHGGRKAHLLEDKQIPSVGVFDEVSFYTLFEGLPWVGRKKNKECVKFASEMNSLRDEGVAGGSPKVQGPQLEEGENLNTRAPGTGRTPLGGTSAPVGQAQGGPSENIDSGGAGSEKSQMGPSAKGVGGYFSDGSSRSRSRGRPRSKSKSVKSKPQSVRASRRKSSLDSGYAIVSDSGSEDLSMPYRRPKPMPFTSRITRFRYHRRAMFVP